MDVRKKRAEDEDGAKGGNDPEVRDRKRYLRLHSARVLFLSPPPSFRLMSFRNGAREYGPTQIKVAIRPLSTEQRALFIVLQLSRFIQG